MRITSIADHGVDLERLRLGRLERLQRAMRDHDVAALLLANEPNVRYATGASAMPVYAMSTFARCALVPQQGTPILFEHGNSMHRSALRAPDVRPMHAWEFYDDPRAAGRDLGRRDARRARGARRRRRAVAVDRLGTPAFLALLERGRARARRRARHAAGPAGQDPRGGRAVRPERRARDGHARGVRSRDRTGRIRARTARGAVRRDGARRRRVPRDHDRVLGAEHESLARRGHRPPARGGGPGVRRHRHRRRGRVLLLRLAHLPGGRGRRRAASSARSTGNRSSGSPR